MFLLDDIILRPIIWIADQINEAARMEISDEGRIKEKLMELQLRFELDEISETEFNKQEKELLERLDASRKAKEEA